VRDQVVGRFLTPEFEQAIRNHVAHQRMLGRRIWDGYRCMRALRESDSERPPPRFAPVLIIGSERDQSTPPRSR
jgi:hypothetical protein